MEDKNTLIKNSKADLLEQLAKIVGCEYLSELKEYRYRNSICEAVKAIPFYSYPAAEWNQAIRYLLCQYHGFDAEEYRKSLMDSLSKNL